MMVFKDLNRTSNLASYRRLRRSTVKFRLGLKKANYQIGRDLKREARRLITEGPKTGRLYRVNVRGRIVLHQASSPGESPANLTGALRQSVDYKVRGTNLELGAGGEQTKGVHAGRNVDYARDLELGNPGRNLAQRPYLKKSIDLKRKIIKRYYEQYIGKSLRG